ncbi:MAG TPA: tRNA pseudouridine(38-40) synthase TruA [Chitinophagaceae bacterium]|nr:tRNA pseudouridine(38-40) synthase TruA [Chitinophagaceae bacterium]
MPRYFIEVAYKGTRYSGFQIQSNANTVQAEVEKALSLKFAHSFRLTGSSRTDAGVHALQNFFHFDISDEFALQRMSGEKEDIFQQSVYGLNAILPDDIAIKKIFRVEDDFHCRFNAISREYKYYIYSGKNPFYKDVAYFYPYPINMDKLQEAASVVLQTIDFTSFSKRNTQVHSFACSVYKSEWKVENDFLLYNIAANRFLRGMVKGLAGTMLKVGTGKISIIDFRKIIDSHNCSLADFSVPSKGLFLVSVLYPGK